MSLHHSPRIVTNNLVFHVDAADRKCYSGGSTCKDLANINGNGTLVDVSFSSDRAFLMNSQTSNIWFNRSYTNVTNSFTFMAFVEIPVLGIGDPPFEVNILSSLNVLAGGISIYATYNEFFGSFVDFYISPDDALTSSDIAYLYAGLLDTSSKKMFIAGVVDGTVNRIYVNGILRSTDSPHTGGSANAQTQIYLGYDNQFIFNTKPNLKIYKALIYNRPLSATEILQNYNAMRGRLGL